MYIFDIKLNIFTKLDVPATNSTVPSWTISRSLARISVQMEIIKNVLRSKKLNLMNALKNVKIQRASQNVPHNSMTKLETALVQKIAHVSLKQYIEYDESKIQKIIDDCPCIYYNCEDGSSPTTTISTTRTTVSTTTSTIPTTNTSILILYKDASYSQYLLNPDDGQFKRDWFSQY